MWKIFVDSHRMLSSKASCTFLRHGEPPCHSTSVLAFSAGLRDAVQELPVFWMNFPSRLASNQKEVVRAFFEGFLPSRVSEA